MYDLRLMQNEAYTERLVAYPCGIMLLWPPLTNTSWTMVLLILIQWTVSLKGEKNMDQQRY